MRETAEQDTHPRKLTKPEKGAHAPHGEPPGGAPPLVFTNLALRRGESYPPPLSTVHTRK